RTRRPTHKKPSPALPGTALGGGGGIRTLEGLPLTRFRGGRHRPLGDSTERNSTGSCAQRKIGTASLHTRPRRRCPPARAGTPRGDGSDGDHAPHPTLNRPRPPCRRAPRRPDGPPARARLPPHTWCTVPESRPGCSPTSATRPAPGPPHATPGPPPSP